MRRPPPNRDRATVGQFSQFKVEALRPRRPSPRHWDDARDRGSFSEPASQ